MNQKSNVIEQASIEDYLKNLDLIYQQSKCSDVDPFDYFPPPQMRKMPSGRFSLFEPLTLSRGASFQDFVRKDSVMAPPPPEPILRTNSKSKIRQMMRSNSGEAKVEAPIKVEIPVVEAPTPMVEVPKQLKNSKKRRNRKEQLDQLPCNCTNSNCLKRYCRCFHSGRKCNANCQCLECKNNSDHDEDRMEAINHVKTKCHRNKKVPKEKLFELKQSWGCNCKKTSCQKNYCECFLRGKKCTLECECENCENGQEEALRQELLKQKQQSTSSRRRSQRL